MIGDNVRGIVTSDSHQLIRERTGCVDDVQVVILDQPRQFPSQLELVPEV